MRVHLEIDFSAFRSELEASQRRLVDETAIATENAAHDGVDEAMRTRRYQDQTGNLTAAGDARLLSSDAREAVAEMSWRVPYASYVDAGTAPHIIRAKGKALAFPGSGGGTVFAKCVKHPGTKGTGFAGVAYLKAERALVAGIERAVEKATENLRR